MSGEDDNYDDFVDAHGIEAWRTRGEWRHQRILIMSQKLKIMLKDGYYGLDEDLYWSLGRFFKTPNLSDIRSREHFQNPGNISILALMSDFSKSTSWFQQKYWYIRAEFIVPVLCWFNRQLTNTTALHVLEEHDQNLIPKMRTAFQHFFEHHFLPNYNPYHRVMSIGISVLPLPQGYYKEHKDLRERFDSLWRPFHDEVFGKASRTEGPPTINKRDWHPYLATCLLQSLAVFLCTWRWYSSVRERSRRDLNEESFSYILRCLPYAETTQQNLDLFRAIVYQFPQPELELDFPEEFWSLSVDFLKKYDRSVLSEEELNLFESSMHSLSQKGPGIQRKGVSFLITPPEDVDAD